jgi:hypothetical protein
MIPVLRALSPEVQSSIDLRSAVASVASRAPVIGLYDYGSNLMSLEALAWVGEVLRTPNLLGGPSEHADSGLGGGFEQLGEFGVEPDQR